MGKTLTDLQSRIGEWTSHDHVALSYRAWLPADRDATRGILLFHRGHEHAGRWEETVAQLRSLGFEDAAFFAWDQRGHGNSPGDRGDAQSVAQIVRDAEYFARHVTTTYGLRTQDLAVVAHSVGAVIAAAWVHDYAPPIRGLVLLAPALRVRLYVPMAIPALRIRQKILGPGYVKSYVKAGMLTHDPAQAAAYQRDPAIFRQISVRMLLDLHDTGKRLIADAGAIAAPTLTLMAQKDWVVDNRAPATFYEHLGSDVKQLEQFPGMYHGMLHERGRERVVSRIGEFLRERFGKAPDYAKLARLDEGGPTRTEYDRLRLPAGKRWGIQRGFLKTVGRLSEGIRIGHRSGFDSGVMLDYVYENQARGATPLGSMIDRSYLNAIGWRGIRIRRQHLEQLLRETIAKMQAQQMPVRIVDIAAGAGRYVLGTLSEMHRRNERPASSPITAVLRDYQEVNLKAARALADSLGLNGTIKVELGDAFDRRSLSSISPRPTIAIVSGLYELFPDNAPVRRSLAGLADALEPGGCLLYTCQPWHPQVELIARTLTNREGRPWIMRRRSQGEMDELVRQAGFVKEEQLIDRWGIFTVSLARKNAEATGGNAAP